MKMFRGFFLGMILLSITSYAQAALQGAEAARFRQLIEPIIYSSSYEVPQTLDYIQYVEKKNVPKEFKSRVEAIRVEMLEQIVAMYPSLCRSDFEDVLTDCLSPLRGSEFYLIYDQTKVLGFVWIGYGVEVGGEGLKPSDSVAYRYIVDRTGHVVQNGYFTLSK